MKYSLLLALLCLTWSSAGQSLYFPPVSASATWDSIEPASLGWCTDSIQPLYDHLEAENTKAFIVLKGGKIVLEKYFGTFTQDSVWYWASAGKTMTAFLTGMAQQEGFLDINDPTSDYLGAGWTSLAPAQEQQITVLNQLTMTSGLDDGGPDSDCTDPNCLTYTADPGTRWAYHNAPYTLLPSVVEAATGATMNNYLIQKLSGTTGIFGLYIPVGYNRVMFSTARSFARFGLLNLAGGSWDGTPIMTDQNYFLSMSTPSQTINNGYGYLWWLNSQSTYMLPGSQIVFPGQLVPQGPADMYCGIGRDDQLLCVVPSQDLVMVRMGNAASFSLVPVVLIKEIWDHLNNIMCTVTHVPQHTLNDAIQIWPNPAQGRDIQISLSEQVIGKARLILFNLQGQQQWAKQVDSSDSSVSLSDLPKGVYILRVEDAKNHIGMRRIVVN